MPDNPTRIILITGYGRSGSTLVNQVLGHIDDMVSVGELLYMWRRSVAENQICECGSQFRDCEFWARVMQAGFGGCERVDGYRVDHLMAEVTSLKHFPELLGLRAGNAEFRKKRAECEQVLQKLFQGLCKVTGDKIIVDSSKSPLHALLVASLPETEAYIVHLVRDSRAVAYSWKKRTKSHPAMKVKFPSRSCVRSSTAWFVSNLLTSWLKGYAHGYALMRYEDLAADLVPALRDMLSGLDLGERDLSFVQGDRVVRSPQHMVTGNPMRFREGDIKVILDEEWTAGMSWAEKAVVEAVTWPQMLRYGYLPQRKI